MSYPILDSTLQSYCRMYSYFQTRFITNITLRNPNISKEKVIEAAELVGARTFIEKLPGGFDYNVMERGSTLSVGQRQLISFVRAMVYDPKIIVLDEATSSVDTETEELIQGAIQKLMKGRTFHRDCSPIVYHPECG